MVKTYTPSTETVDTLRELYELEGSYAGVARSLNRGRRSSSKQFTPRQVSRMLNRRNVGGDGSGYSKQNDPKPVRLTPAQQRSLQRKAKTTSGTYRRTFEDSKAPQDIYNSIKRNIDNKISRKEKQLEEALAFGQFDRVERLEDELSRLKQFDDELKDMAGKAKDYKDWKGIQDANTP